MAWPRPGRCPHAEPLGSARNIARRAARFSEQAERIRTIPKAVALTSAVLMKRLGIDGIIAIGGEGTLAGAKRLADDGIPVLGVPKTIDNDLAATDYTFGFDTAVEIATEAGEQVCERPATATCAAWCSRSWGVMSAGSPSPLGHLSRRAIRN